ncbi:hypothetical protein H0H92_013596, partial [Tricholoma furcatifolium]
PQSTSKPASTAKPKSKQGQPKKSSVDRLQEDLAADAAGRPKKLKGTGRILERSGISVAPPEHVHSSGATIPPRPTRMVSSRIRIDPEAADQ